MSRWPDLQYGEKLPPRLNKGDEVKMEYLKRDGGLLSLVGIAVAAFFFGGLVFDYSLGDVPLEEAGFFTLAVAWFLQRVGL